MHTDTRARIGGSGLTAGRLLLTLAVAASACGYLAEKGKEPKGDANQPDSGVGVFEKQDFDCGTDLIQPFMVKSTRQAITAEPWVIREDGSWRMWFEQRIVGGTAAIRYTTFSIEPAVEDCRTYDVPAAPAEEVFAAPKEGWEEAGSPNGQGGVGAPTILYENGVYRMWYEGGEWAGIGYAESTDGVRWTRMDASGRSDTRNPREVRPLLVPDQAWEKGSIGSPTVVFHGGLYRMWYDGNEKEARAIGYAESTDGLTWVKRDALGRTSTSSPGEVEPVVVANQPNWEFNFPTDPFGTVGTPMVIVHRSPLRSYYLLYYTGDLSGRLSVPMTDADSSIGIAFSMDGLNWAKAPSFSIPSPPFPLDEAIAMEINPIVDEKLPISLGAPVPDSSNGHSAFSNVDEAGPMVVEVPEQLTFYMFWQQIDGINLLRGMNGIGFAFARNAKNIK